MSSYMSLNNFVGQTDPFVFYSLWEVLVSPQPKVWFMRQTGLLEKILLYYGTNKSYGSVIACCLMDIKHYLFLDITFLSKLGWAFIIKINVNYTYKLLYNCTIVYMVHKHHNYYNYCKR